MGVRREGGMQARGGKTLRTYGSTSITNKQHGIKTVITFGSIFIYLKKLQHEFRQFIDKTLYM